MVGFTVVDIQFPYNIIMRLPLINKVKAVISTHQLLIQYEKDDDKVGILYGDQTIARERQVNTLKMGIESNDREYDNRKRKAEQVESVLHVTDDDTCKMTQPQPVEGFKEVAIWGEEKNKACPKDDYMLPKIDNLVDANVGYHQIPLTVQNRQHIAFITPTEVYCYMVLPFSQKNAGATYQRMVNKIFKYQISRNLEVYVDDVIAKSKKIMPDISVKHSRKSTPTECISTLKKVSSELVAESALAFLLTKKE